MVQKKSETQILQARITELEEQLAEAQAAILALQSEKGRNIPSKPSGPAGTISFLNEEGYKPALQAVPYPVMIWREDGRIMMVNTALTEITGYTLDDLPTLEQWSNKVFDGQTLDHPSLIYYEEFPGRDIRKTREFEITTRTGEKRIWDFSYAVLGADQDGRWLMITMAVDVSERRQIEEQLEANEHKFSIIFDKAPYAAALSRLPQGIITHINEEFERVFGYTRQEVLGKTSAEVGLNPDPQGRERILAQIQAQGSARNIEIGLHTKAGEARTFLLNLDQVSIEGEKYVLQTAQDITERKQAEKDLKESEQRYRGLFEQMQEGLVAAEVITDENGTPIDYRYLDVNPATERQFSIPRGEFIGRTYTEVLPEGDQEWIKILGGVALTGEPASVERYGRASGKWFEAHAYSPRPGQFINILTDITERKKAEEALRKSEERFSKAFHSSPDAIIISRIADGLIIEANDGWGEMFGHDLSEVLGHTSIELNLFANPEDRKEAIRRIQEQGSVRNFELEIRKKSGEIRLASLSAEKIEVNGEAALLTVLRDITERKEAEEALRKSEERFSKAFHSSPDAVIISRMSDGTIIEVNESWTRIFGHKPSEVIGRTSAEVGAFVRPEDRKRAIDIIQKKGSVRDFELQVRCKSGEIRQASMSVERLEMYGIDYLLTNLRDITERKQAEEQIVYQAKLLASVNDAIVGSDAEYRLTAWNTAAESIYGWKAEEVLGRIGLEILQTQWPQQQAAEMRRQIAETGSWRGEATQLRKDGIRIPVEVSSMVLRNEHGDITGYVSVNRDITQRKKVERALMASEAKMRAVFRALTEGVVFLNRDGEVEEANDAVQLTYDHTIEELSDPQLDPRARIIRPDGTPFPEEEQPAILALRTGETVRDVELGVPTRDGKISWRLVNAQPVLDDQGSLLGVVASFFDITERKMAEQALRESEERFRSLADSMPQLVWTALPDGRVDYYNERYQEYQDIKQLQGQDWEWAPVLHPDDAQATVDAWLHSVITGETYQIEHRVRTKDGSYRWHLSRGLPMLDEKGKIVRWFGTATDIHDLKQVEEQAKIYASRLEKSNRELEQFAFMASHDLQEPLRKIEMFGDLLLERATNLQENERLYLDRMRNAASRMRGMIEGLLQISRVATQGRSFVRVDLSRVTQEVISDFEDQIRDSNGSIELGSLPAVNGDPLQLRQLMQNLISNALKYHQPGRPPEISIFAKQLPEKVQICVQDKGIGFPQADADRVFEPFQRLVARSQYEGSGIGLAICRRIVERHGGEIAALSEPGQGTTFIVNLPKTPGKKTKKTS